MLKLNIFGAVHWYILIQCLSKIHFVLNKIERYNIESFGPSMFIDYIWFVYRPGCNRETICCSSILQGIFISTAD